MTYSAINNRSGAHTAAPVIIGKTALAMKKPHISYVTAATAAPARVPPMPRIKRYIMTPASHKLITVNHPYAAGSGQT